MSDKDLEKLEEFKAEQSGSNKGMRAGTYMADLKVQGLEEQKKKEKEREAELLQHSLLQIQNELDGILGEIGGKLDEFRDSRDRQKRMAQAENNGDFEALRHIFINEYGMDADQVNNMSHDELRDQRIKFDEVETQNQAVIIAEIKELAKQYRERAKELGEDRPDLAQAELDKLDAIKYRCAAMGLDFEKIFDDTVQNGHTDFQIAINENDRADDANGLNDKFNRVAPNNHENNPFLSNENDGNNPFLSDNDAQSTPNPFG